MENHENGINRDGTFRTQRIGTRSFTLSNLYSSLVTMPWSRFFLLIFLAYLLLTLLFTLAYLWAGLDNMSGLNAIGASSKFWEIFFYSAQTMSTMGSTGISPIGATSNFILTIESMMSLLYMAVITGLLFVRFSKPTSKIVFSNKALISPYKDGKGLMIRIASATKQEVIELSAHLFYVVFDPVLNRRNFKELKLEQSTLPFSSATWTIVHPITDESPFHQGNTELQNIRFNIVLYIGATDRITGQRIDSRQAYSKTDILWNTNFLPCTEMNDDGEILVYLDKISDCKGGD